MHYNYDHVDESKFNGWELIKLAEMCMNYRRTAQKEKRVCAKAFVFLSFSFQKFEADEYKCGYRNC